MRKLLFLIFFLSFTFQIPLKWMYFLHSFQPSGLFLSAGQIQLFHFQFLLPPEDTLASDLICSELLRSSMCVFLENLAALQRLMAKLTQNRGSQCTFKGKHHSWTDVFCTGLCSAGITSSSLFLSSLTSESSHIFWIWIFGPDLHILRLMAGKAYLSLSVVV